MCIADKLNDNSSSGSCDLIAKRVQVISNQLLRSALFLTCNYYLLFYLSLQLVRGMSLTSFIVNFYDALGIEKNASADEGENNQIKSKIHRPTHHHFRSTKGI